MASDKVFPNPIESEGGPRALCVDIGEWDASLLETRGKRLQGCIYRHARGRRGNELHVHMRTSCDVPLLIESGKVPRYVIRNVVRREQWWDVLHSVSRDADRMRTTCGTHLAYQFQLAPDVRANVRLTCALRERFALNATVRGGWDSPDVLAIRCRELAASIGVDWDDVLRADGLVSGASNFGEFTVRGEQFGASMNTSRGMWQARAQACAVAEKICDTWRGSLRSVIASCSQIMTPEVRSDAQAWLQSLSCYEYQEIQRVWPRPFSAAENASLQSHDGPAVIIPVAEWHFAGESQGGFSDEGCVGVLCRQDERPRTLVMNLPFDRDVQLKRLQSRFGSDVHEVRLDELL